MIEKELQDESVAFIIFLYRHYVKIKNIVDKIRLRKDIIDADDCDTIEPLHKEFLEERRKNDG